MEKMQKINYILQKLSGEQCILGKFSNKNLGLKKDAQNIQRNVILNFKKHLC